MLTSQAKKAKWAGLAFIFVGLSFRLNNILDNLAQHKNDVFVWILDAAPG